MIRLGNSSVTVIGGAANWTNFSDARFKNNIKENVKGLDFIMKLKPVTFNYDMHKLDAYTGIDESVYKDSEEMNKARNDKEKIVYTGFLAQQVEEAAKQCGFDFSGVVKPQNEKTPYSLAYAEFVVPLVKGMQEQQKQIEDLKQQVEDLKTLLAEVLVKKDGK
jgi:O-methyltransferase involved in polyketide biosynthesis